MPESERPPTRRRRAAAPVVVSLLALVCAGLGMALPTEAGAAGCGPAPEGQIAVVVVVDRGGAPGARCATVPQGSTGLDVLRAAGHVVRLDGGFVCAIDGVPATGCGNRPSEGPAYWRYWHAPPSGAWTYSQVGAGGYRLPARCAVEGWVWSDSQSSNTPPSIGAPQVQCEATAVTALPSTARPAPAPTAVTGAPAAPTGDPSDPAPPSAGVAGADGPSAGAAPGSDASTAEPGATAAPAEVQGATTVPDDADATAGGTSSDRSGRADPTRASDDGDRVEVADGSPVSAPASSAPPWGLLVGVLLIAGVGGGAWWRSRHDRTEGA